MDIVFFGSSNFAVSSLKALLTTKHTISCVVTQPDKEKGRGLNLAQTPVKILAKDSGLRVYQPESINISEAIKFLKNLKPDLFVVIAYGQILSQEVLDIPKIFSINVHASLLSKYRGAAPINWAIINGEKTTGITIIKMTKNLDAGHIIFQKSIDIEETDTSLTLEKKLFELAADILIGAIKSIENNNYKLTSQDEDMVSFAPELKKEDGLISWNSSAGDIYNLIRGSLSWPGAFTYYNGRLLKIYKARVNQLADSCLSAGRVAVGRLPGEIIEVSKDGIAIVCGKGDLIIEELQLEGKRRMKAEEFIAGHKICVGEVFGKK